MNGIGKEKVRGDRTKGKECKKLSVLLRFGPGSGL